MEMRLSRRTLLLTGAASSVLGWGSFADGQSFPTKPLRWILGVPAGGGLDIQARILAETMATVLGQPVIVDNRPGASGAIAAMAVAQSPLDGHTLITFNVGDYAWYPYVSAKPAYNPAKDFDMIAMLTDVPFIMMSTAKIPVNDAKEFVDYVKTQPPGSINYSSGGTNSYQHLMMELFSQQAGIKMTHIPYRGGSQALTDLVAGQNQVQFTVAANAAPFVTTGQLKALGVAFPERLEAFPEIPTLVEQGFKIDVPAWAALATAAGTPPAVIERLNAAAMEAIKAPAFVSKMREVGVIIRGSTSQEATRYCHEQIIEWGVTLKKLNIKSE
jgi:tripartite-type tricarboxylate transporter receptor subunit TctC